METAEVFHCARSHVYRTLARFEELGWLGLLDGRRDNGARKTDAAFCSVVRDLLEQSPRDYGYLRYASPWQPTANAARPPVRLAS
jgi:Winged helix-turn helix